MVVRLADTCDRLIKHKENNRKIGRMQRPFVVLNHVLAKSSAAWMSGSSDKSKS